MNGWYGVLQNQQTINWKQHIYPVHRLLNLKKTAYYDPINNHHLTHRDDACKRDTSYHISTCTQQALTLAFRVVVTRGIMKYFKFSFALFGHYQSGRLFPTTFVSPQPKTEPRWSEYSNRKKTHNLAQTNPTRILMNFTNCFSSLQICLIKM